LLTFGPEANLGPIPIRLAAQPRRSLEHIPDTATDWLVTKFGDVRAVSTRGHSHRYVGEVREDSFGLAEGNGFLVLAVADGVGRAGAGHLGSAIAARRAVTSTRIVNRAFEQRDGVGSCDLSDIAEALAAVADDRGLVAAEVSTTLIVAIVRPPTPDSLNSIATIVQLGDSSAWRIAGGTWQKLGPHASAHAADDLVEPGVAALPGHTMASIWNESFAPDETLAIVSDGIGNIIPANTAYASALAELWAASAPSPGELLRVVDSTVKTFDDDRTLVSFRFSGASA
jgi:serine/threonine protein phosphatase PrpC